MVDVLRHMLGDPLPETSIESVDAWWAAKQRTPEFVTPAARAFAGGFAMDRVGYAFASGYVEALGSLVPSLVGVITALCATEKGGSHPRAITTRLTQDGDHYRATGQKGFVTLATHAEELVVVVSEGLDDHDRNRLKMVRLPRSREGLSLEMLPPTPFVPEIPHAKLTLDDVVVHRDEILPGDGFEDYLKPFRTVEDLHVHAALVGYLIQLGRRHGWPRVEMTELAMIATAIYPLALAEPLDAAVHVALAGVLDRTHALVERIDWTTVDEVTKTRFLRDRPLLQVAGSARVRRLETAWTRLMPPV